MDRQKIQQIVAEMNAVAAGRPRMQLMEICGTHTVALFRTGVKSMMPPNVKLVSGPGCPVCVTSSAYMDAACELAGRPGVTICTYGDMVRVPGKKGSLEHARGRGADVMVVYSARDAVAAARQKPARQIVFLAVGFETTTPATAAAVLEAQRDGLENFFILPAHKLVVPALQALLAGQDTVPIDGFLCPGHVSVIIGAGAYRPIAAQYHKPCVVTGFEPIGMLQGILGLIRQVAQGRADVENAYGVAVSEEGNAIAQRMIDQVFQPAPAMWRALGTIPGSGLDLREPYRRFDAFRQFGVTLGEDYEYGGCLCGQVIQGKIDPPACPLFAKRCTPITPIGPCMVSSEGTCAAWYKYGRPTEAQLAGKKA